MTSHEHLPVPSDAPAITDAPAGPPIAASAPAGHSPSVPPVVPPAYAAQPERRSKAWAWWTLGILIVVGGLVASCALPLMWIGRGSTTPSAGLGSAVGLIRVEGVIAGTGSTFDGYVTPRDFRDLLKQAENDSSIKAVVLRIDSPGGTVAASEEIARYAKEFGKPLVVSIGDVGASGAYMLASQSDEIWAMPGSAVGSIGVIAQIPNVGELLDKVGVDFQVVTAGEYKDAGSPYRELTDEERALIQGEVDDAYDQFVGIVAEGRGMTTQETEKLATGWAWNGEKAKELGLVDEIGTLEDALDSAATLGDISGDYRIVEIGEDSFEDLLGSLMGVSAQLKRLGALSDTANDVISPVVIPR